MGGLLKERGQTELGGFKITNCNFAYAPVSSTTWTMLDLTYLAE